MRHLVRAAFVLALSAIALPLFATEPNPSARQRELVEKLLVLMDMDHIERTVSDAMFGEIEKQIVAAAEHKGTDVTEAKELFTLFRTNLVRDRDRLEDDIIFGDYAFVQLPVQAKPEQEN